MGAMEVPCASGSRRMATIEARYAHPIGIISAMSIPERLRPRLLGFPSVRLAVLFGSAARGEATARSDVDLALLPDADAPPDALWEIECDLAAELRRPLHLVDLRRAPPLLRFEIARDGVVVVERQPGAWSGFQARAMLDWWDWAPTARAVHRIAAERLREELADGAP